VKCAFRPFRRFPLASYLICEKVNLRWSLLEFDVMIDKSEIFVGVELLKWRVVRFFFSLRGIVANLSWECSDSISISVSGPKL
jgi:hypothetical protein